MNEAFSDRLAALVEERRSQVCLGLDPDPAARAAPAAEIEPGTASDSGGAAAVAAAAVAAHCEALIEQAAGSCVAVKLQLACFERLGAPGWEALSRAASAAREHGLLVIADGKRGDVAVSAAAYGQALFGSTATPWGEIGGLRADAATLNPLLGRDALEPLLEAAAAAAAGVFILVRTSNPGAADLLDSETAEGPLFERIARLVASEADRLRGSRGLTGVGAVVGATEPRHLERLRELMPGAIFLLPGVGAQGGSVADLGPAFAGEPAAALVTASRSIAGAADPAAAAEALRAELWDISQ